MITLDRGIKIRRLDLWLDATRSRPLSFVSHAHQDHVARHQEAIMSPFPANLFQKRNSGIKKITRLNFHEPLQRNGIRVELFPESHVLGSAQILIENDHRIVYTGDFKLRPSRTTEPIVFMPCDILIMESTFGRPHYIFSPVEENIHQLTISPEPIRINCQAVKDLVPKGGFEPPWGHPHYALNVACLPVSPLRQIWI